MEKIDYHFLKSWKPILIISCIVVFLFQGFYYLHPANHAWMFNGTFSWLNLLRFLLIDQILLECISVGMIFRLIIVFSEYFKIDELSLSFRGISQYFLKFLPLFLVSFFFFSPATLTARFLFHHLPALPWSVYWKEYFFLSSELYLVYLIPALMYGYGGLILNLLSNYKKQEIRPQKDKSSTFQKHLAVKNASGLQIIEIKNIKWIERKNRKYYVYSTAGEFLTDLTITELEAILDPQQFIRVNRASVVNIAQIQGYSFWENEKYILRLCDGKEFVVSRQRMKGVKEMLQLYSGKFLPQ